MLKKILDFLTKQVFTNVYSQRLFIIILSIILLMFIVISPIGTWLDNTFYDLFITMVKKPVKQHESLLLVDIDDNAMNLIPYRWPWPRNIHGDALEMFAEFGARAVIFDIEFLGPSPAGVSYEAAKVYEENIATNFSGIMELSQQMAEAFILYPDARRDPNPILNDFNMQLGGYYNAIYDDYSKVVYDNDIYFSNRVRYFGKVYGTVNMMYDESLATEERYQQIEAASLENLKKYGIPINNILPEGKSHPGIIDANITEFPVQVILDQYNRIGYTKVFRDVDAAIRAIPLFMQKKGYVIPQLSFSPFLHVFDVSADQIDLSRKNRIILRDVVISGKKRTIRIPLDSKSMMRINWPSGQFHEIFPYNKKQVADGKEEPLHFSYYNLLNYKYNIEQIFERNLENFAGFPNDEPERQLLDEYTLLKNQKKMMVDQFQLDETMRESWLQEYSYYMNKLYQYVSDDEIANWEKTQRIKLKGSPYSAEEIDALLGEIRLIKVEISSSIDMLLDIRKTLTDILTGKICFVGYTATGTTDIGSNPFDRDFENVGTHPSIFNTILQHDFISMFPVWLSVIITILLFAGLVWVVSKRTAALMAVAGFGSTVLALAGITIFFYFTNIYISPVSPLFYGLFTAIIMIVIKYILNEKEKSQIRNTFNRYLSPVVINEILKNPGEVELGGERRNCTAIFTDVEGFSSISEQFKDDPKSLVSLLNKYLSAMTDIILENGGTIDKYEGDAIIGFFGAPLDMPDHPYKTCLSSIRMKQAEERLNKSILEEGIVTRPLLTRIGINTGDMFVGNIGTQNRLDYTMMGHAVNLAARLEGVNKQYGIYQLISEYTNELIKDKIMTRKLDKVRVVNIKTPIRLYELIGLRDEVSTAIRETNELFHSALDKFENQEWQASLDLFMKVKKKTVNDAPTDLYIGRCKKFLKKSPPDNWDGVYNLSVK